MSFIECRINGNNLKLKVTRRKFVEGRGKWTDESHRAVKTHCDNIWPWRFMKPGQCVTVPYEYANYKQMQNSINGFTRHAKSVKFSYRSEADGLAVWCKTKES